MVNWMYYPKSDKPSDLALAVVKSFESVSDAIDSATHKLKSNEVLQKVAPSLQESGFKVKAGKKAKEKLSVDADAFQDQEGFVVEVEAGRGRLNNEFLKDLFQACMMQDVFYLGIAVRNTYQGQNDFEIVVQFFNTLYASQRLQLPLKGILILGY